MTYISVTDTAKMIRQELKQFGVKFSVKSSKYAGGASIDIAWTDGPDTEAVKEVVNKFQGADFDGMQDMKIYRQNVLNGEKVHFGADFIFCNRQYSHDYMVIAANETIKQLGIGMTVAEFLNGYKNGTLASDAIDGEWLRRKFRDNLEHRE